MNQNILPLAESELCQNIRSGSSCRILRIAIVLGCLALLSLFNVSRSFASTTTTLVNLNWTSQYVPGTTLSSYTTSSGDTVYTSTFSEKETGIVTGTCVGVESGTMYPNGFSIFTDECVFSGSVGSKSGTFFQIAQGSSNPNACPFGVPSPFISGTFSFIGISGGLWGSSGEGTWTRSDCSVLTDPSGTYSGTIYFD